MKSHSLAKDLIALGEALLRAPNVETKSLNSLVSLPAAPSKQDQEMAFGVTTLAQLSHYSKAEWLSFAENHNIPIEFNRQDSSRNIMGKIMSYLADNQSEIERVRDSVADVSGSSNRLNNAFSILLKNS
nr:hypothetical protein [uncultured Sphingomonas sp.]